MKTVNLFEETQKNSNYKFSIFTEDEISELKERLIRHFKKNKATALLTCIKKKKGIKITPKELIRQLYAARLIKYGYPVDRIAFEYPIEAKGKSEKADIVVLDKNNPNDIYIVVVLKETEQLEGEKKVRSFCNAANAKIGVWTNGSHATYFHRKAKDNFEILQTLPKGDKPTVAYKLKGEVAKIKPNALDSIGSVTAFGSRGKAIDSLGTLGILKDINRYKELYRKLMPHIAMQEKYGSLITKATAYANYIDNSPGISAAVASLDSSNIKNFVPDYTGKELIGRITGISAAIEFARNANNSILEMQKAVVEQDITKHFTSAFQMDKSWKLYSENAERLTASLTGTKQLISNGFSQALKLTASAQANLHVVSFDRIKEQFNLNEQMKIALDQTVTGLTASYSEFYNSIRYLKEDMFTLPPEAIFLPPKEFYWSTKLLKTISIDEEEYEEEEEKEELQKETDKIVEENEDDVNKYLAELNPKLINLRKGALQAKNSKTSDRIRHFSISYRELITRIIHELAPDERIKQWTQDERLFDNGRPKRKARLLYICRGVNSGPFKDFFENDVKSSLKLIDLFQEGTHALEANFSEKQIETLSLKADSLIVYLLKISKLN